MARADGPGARRGADGDAPAGPGPRAGLALVLLGSAALRVALVLRGGQYYWPDEDRYRISQQLFSALRAGEWSSAALGLSQSPDHLGFKLLGLLPAALEQALGSDPRIPALFFGASSVLALWLAWRIALAAGAGGREALLAALLLALSSSFLYYSRHLLPYDAGMALGLLALWAALGRPSGLRCALCGLAAAAAFLTYNGYWTLAGLALLVRALEPWEGPAELARRAGAAALGATLPVLALAAAAAGGDLIGAFQRFSGTIHQGEFDEGWSLPFAYLWHAEGALLAILGAGVVGALWPQRGVPLARRARLWLLAAAGIYAALAFTSVVLERFVVYGRLARQIVPFLCLLAAHGLERLRRSGRIGSRLAQLACALAIAAAAMNFRQPLAQEFPRDFAREARRVGAAEGGPWALLYAEHLYPEARAALLPPHEVVLRAPHPLQYLPYQYEGYTPAQRESLREVDISMRLVRRLDAAGQ